jgi:hypothetical protein
MTKISTIFEGGIAKVATLADGSLSQLERIINKYKATLDA